MDLEVSLSNRTDRQFALFAFFGGDRGRQMQAEKVARRLSNGKYDDHRSLESAYKGERDDEAKRDIYNKFCYERLYTLMYLQQTSKQSGLLVQPTFGAPGTPTNIVKPQGWAPK